MGLQASQTVGRHVTGIALVGQLVKIETTKQQRRQMYGAVNKSQE